LGVRHVPQLRLDALLSSEHPPFPGPSAKGGRDRGRKKRNGNHRGGEPLEILRGRAIAIQRWIHQIRKATIGRVGKGDGKMCDFGGRRRLGGSWSGKFIPNAGYDRGGVGGGLVPRHFVPRAGAGGMGFSKTSPPGGQGWAQPHGDGTSGPSGPGPQLALSPGGPIRSGGGLVGGGNRGARRGAPPFLWPFWGDRGAFTSSCRPDFSVSCLKGAAGSSELAGIGRAGPRAGGSRTKAGRGKIKGPSAWPDFFLFNGGGAWDDCEGAVGRGLWGPGVRRAKAGVDRGPGGHRPRMGGGRGG